MSLRAAVVVPAAPLIVPAVAGGSAGVDRELRETVLGAVGWLVAQSCGQLVVVAGAPTTGPVAGTWDWSRLGVPLRGSADGPALPLGLAVGAWLVEACGGSADGGFVGVADALPAQECASLGSRLAADGDLRMLVVADGSARRDEKAPGHLDPRAEAFDRGVAQALAGADADALLSLDPLLATALLASGRAAWQVLAGAADGTEQGELAYAGAPHGVGYFVARWQAA